MAVGTAGGFRQLSGITIPEIWSGKLLVKFYDASTYAAISNTDYEGEISNLGDKVIIRTTPDIIIRDYVKGQNLDYENPEPETTELLIDKAKYYAYNSDDIDRKQSDIDYIEDWAEDASEQMRIAVDTDINQTVIGDVAAANQGATAGVRSGSFNLGAVGAPLAITKTNVIDVLIDCATVLDEQSVPESDRWIVIPPWMAGLIKKSDLKDASLAGDGVSIARNGRLGMIDRWMLYSSNLLSTADDGGTNVTNIIFGQRHALSFASQLVKDEVLPNPHSFGTLHRGLNVYGYEVLKGDAMGLLYAYKG
jgi:hypothetical protein